MSTIFKNEAITITAMGGHEARRGALLGSPTVAVVTVTVTVVTVTVTVTVVTGC